MIPWSPLVVQADLFRMGLVLAFRMSPDLAPYAHIGHAATPIRLGPAARVQGYPRDPAIPPRGRASEPHRPSRADRPDWRSRDLPPAPGPGAAPFDECAGDS